PPSCATGRARAVAGRSARAASRSGSRCVSSCRVAGFPGCRVAWLPGCLVAELPGCLVAEQATWQLGNPATIQYAFVIKARVITCSDGVSSGHREDLSGPAVREILEKNGFEVDAVVVVP